MTLHPIPLNYQINEENFISFFISAPAPPLAYFVNLQASRPPYPSQWPSPTSLFVHVRPSCLVPLNLSIVNHPVLNLLNLSFFGHSDPYLLNLSIYWFLAATSEKRIN